MLEAPARLSRQATCTGTCKHTHAVVSHRPPKRGRRAHTPLQHNTYKHHRLLTNRTRHLIAPAAPPQGPPQAGGPEAAFLHGSPRICPQTTAKGLRGFSHTLQPPPTLALWGQGRRSCPAEALPRLHQAPASRWAGRGSPWQRHRRPRSERVKVCVARAARAPTHRGPIGPVYGGVLQPCSFSEVAVALAGWNSCSREPSAAPPRTAQKNASASALYKP